MCCMEGTPRSTVIRRDLRWVVSDQAGDFDTFEPPSWAAAWLVDLAMRQHLKGSTPGVSVQLQDRVLGAMWDASADAEAVMAAVRWPSTEGDILERRLTAITLIRDILISDEPMMDAPEPGMTDPHTYALVCR